MSSEATIDTTNRFCFKEIIKSKCLRLFSSLMWFIICALAMWVFYFKPTFEHLGLKEKQALEIMMIYPDAKSEGSSGRIRLEQLSHEDSFIAVVMLESLYISDSVKKSGIRLEDQDADLSKIDTSGRDRLVLQAYREYSDLELKYVLSSNSQLLSLDPDKEADSDIAEFPNISTKLKNNIRLQYSTSLTKEQKSELLACKEKLDEKFSNAFWILANLRSHGTCSKNYRSGFDVMKSSAFN